jgi:TldD protein
MNDRMRRRDFLKYAGAGSALVSLPGWAGCSGKSGAFEATSTASPTGAHTTYFERFGINETLIGRVMQKALSRGGDFCDIYFEHTISHTTGLQDGQVNRARMSVDLGAGIRVLKNEATGYAYSEELSEKSLLAAADTASAIADSGSGARPVALRAVAARSLYPVDVPWSEIGVDRKLPILEQADRIARAHDPRISKVRVFIIDDTTRVLLVNSEGRLVEDDRPMATFYVSCVAVDGDRIEMSDKSFSARQGFAFVEANRVADITRRTAAEAIRAFEAVDPPAGEMPVVLAAGTSGILLHEAIGHGMEADFNRKNLSIYADKIGTRIASDLVTIVDDGTLPGLRGSLNVDDEGNPTQRTVLVEQGILRSYLHDRISAQHYGVSPTGSGRRQSFRHPPVPRMRSTTMESGPHDPQEIIASVEKGIYAETFANGEVKIGVGDFTFYVMQGRLIENGKLTSVIKDTNLIGNGPAVLASIDMVGNDSQLMESGGSCGKEGQFVPVGFGLPTVRAHAITVGGRNA